MAIIVAANYNLLPDASENEGRGAFYLRNRLNFYTFGVYGTIDLYRTQQP